MSENTPVPSNEELEQVAGGNAPNSAQEYSKLQDQFSKMSQTMDTASTMGKKMNDTRQLIIRNVG